MKQMWVYHVQFEEKDAHKKETVFPHNVSVAATDYGQAITLASLVLKGGHGPLLSLKRAGHIFVPGLG